MEASLPKRNESMFGKISMKTAMSRYLSGKAAATVIPTTDEARLEKSCKTFYKFTHSHMRLEMIPWSVAVGRKMDFKSPGFPSPTTAQSSVLATAPSVSTAIPAQRSPHKSPQRRVNTNPHPPCPAPQHPTAPDHEDVPSTSGACGNGGKRGTRIKCQSKEAGKGKGVVTKETVNRDIHAI